MTEFQSAAPEETPLLQVDDLAVRYRRPGILTRYKSVIDGVSFSLQTHESIGLIGESGSGKTTIGRSILGLAPVHRGTITFDAQDITNLSRKSRRHLAADVQVIFQDPYSSLNPLMTIGQILMEPLRVLGRKARSRSVEELLDLVELPRDVVDRLPREFSGGQRQRVAIARALSVGPRLLICDEPTSALDMATQSHILELLSRLRADSGLSYIFISHDIGIVRMMTDRIAVLKNGRIVEQGASDEVAMRPKHEYTKGLLLSTLLPEPEKQEARRLVRQQFFAAAKKDSMDV